MANDLKDDKFQKLEDNYSQLEERSRTVQQIANEITKETALGRKRLEFLRSELSKYEAISKESPDLKKFLPADDSWLQQAIKDSDKAITGMMNAESTLNQTVTYVGTAVSTVSVVGSMAVSGVNLLTEKYPGSQIFCTYHLQDPKIVFDSTDSDAVSKLLEEYDPELEKERRGAWDTFFSNSSANHSQAAHSMRDVLRKLIRKHASNNAVKAASWWTWAESTEDGVSRKQRLRLLAYGATAEVSENELDFMTAKIEEFEESYDFLNKTAHGSKQTEVAIEGWMKSIEHLLLLILRRRKLSITPGTDKLTFTGIHP